MALINSGSGSWSDSSYAGPNGQAAYTIALRVVPNYEPGSATNWEQDFGGAYQSDLVVFGSTLTLSLYDFAGFGLGAGFILFDGSGNEMALDLPWSAGSELRVAARVDGSGCRMWVNGVELTTVDFGGGSLSSPATATPIGLINAQNASLGDIAVWHSALTPAECAAATDLTTPVYPGSRAYGRYLDTSAGSRDDTTGGAGSVTEASTTYTTHSPSPYATGGSTITGTVSTGIITTAAAASGPLVPGTAALSITTTATVDGAVLPAGAVDVDPGTTLQNWHGFRATVDMSELDSAIVANASSQTGVSWDASNAILDSVWSTAAQAGLTHLRVDISAYWSGVGVSPPVNGNIANRGPYTSTGFLPDPTVLDAKMDDLFRFQAAVRAEGRTPLWTLQCVAWDDDNIHGDPAGDPGANFVGFLMGALERFRTVWNQIPDYLVITNEPDLGAPSTVTPARLARSLDKTLTALDAVSGQPYASTKIVFPEVSGWLSDFGTQVGAYTPAEYLTELQSSYPARVSRVDVLGFHVYPDGNNGAGGNVDAYWTEAQTYGIPETGQGEYWDSVALTDDIYDQITRARASYVEIFTVGGYPQNATTDPAGSSDWGYMETSGATGTWGSSLVGYSSGPAEATLRPYVRYLQPGAVRLSDTSTVSGVRSTSWRMPDGRIIVVAEETAGGSPTFAITGLSGISWNTIEIDDGSGPVTANPASISLSANALAAVVFTPNYTAGTASGALALSATPAPGVTMRQAASTALALTSDPNGRLVLGPTGGAAVALTSDPAPRLVLGPTGSATVTVTATPIPTRTVSGDVGVTVDIGATADPSVTARGSVALSVALTTAADAGVTVRGAASPALGLSGSPAAILTLGPDGSAALSTAAVAQGLVVPSGASAVSAGITLAVAVTPRVIAGPGASASLSSAGSATSGVTVRGGASSALATTALVAMGNSILGTATATVTTSTNVVPRLLVGLAVAESLGLTATSTARVTLSPSAAAALGISPSAQAALGLTGSASATIDVAITGDARVTGPTSVVLVFAYEDEIPVIHVVDP